VFAHRPDHQPEHVDFALGVMGGERKDVAAGVVEYAVDAHRLAFAVNQERRTVTHVGVPESAGPLCLPSKPYLTAAVVSASERDAVESLLLVETAHAARGDGARFEATLGDQRAQDDRDRRRGVLLADRRQELALRLGEVAAPTPVGARRRPQSLQIARLIRIVPTLERCDRVRFGGLGARRSEPLLAQLGKRRRQLAAV
jgi:hypothetical protein